MLRSFGNLAAPPTKGPAIFGPTQNLLLRMLPSLELSALLSDASEVNLQPGMILRDGQKSLLFIDFPMSGFISLDVIMRNQQSVETALVGHNSAVELLVGLGIDYVPGRAVVQAPGRAVRIPVTSFKMAAARSPLVRDMIIRGVALLFWETQQNVTCAAFHDVQSRLCRWLVRCHDFCYGEAIPLTQDFLARMLAVRRTTITLAASALQDAGIIQYRRGVIQVLDRIALEERSCECHSIVAEQAGRMMAPKLEKNPQSAEFSSPGGQSRD